MKKILSTLTALSFMFAGVAPAMAGDESFSNDYDAGDIESLEAERYWQVAKKWQVEIEFEDGYEKTFYVYNISDTEELYEEIQDAIKDNFGFKPLSSFVSSILDFDESQFFGSESDSKGDIEEIEAERYEQIEGKWEVEVEYGNDKEETFYVYEIEDEEELISEIADKLDLSDDEVEELLEFEEDEFDDEEEDDDYYQTFGVKKITAERVWSVIGKWEIKAQFEDSSKNTKVYYVYNIESEDELLEQIAGGLVLEKDELKGIDVDIRDNDFDGEDSGDKEEEKEEVKKDTSNNTAKEAQIAALEKQIQDLLQLLIALLTKQLTL